MEEFKKLGLSDDVINTLRRKGYVTPTEIQQRAIPILLDGKLDIIAQSQTGTGKTASFALPIIEKIKERANNVQAIILTPTRELAIQVAKEIESLIGRKRLRVLAVYGGTSVNDQMKQLRQGVDIVVGTPGRVMDQINRKSLNLSKVAFTVLDEADEMLNMGFLEEMEKILERTNPETKMLLFSATISREIHRIAKRFMRKHVVLEIENKELTIGLTEQIYYEVMAGDRFEALRRVIDISGEFYGIVFCRTRVDVDAVSRKLLDKNYSAAAIHGDISQEQREKILNLFRDRRVNILIATDVAARGIDVNDLTHVVNYALPQSPESYVHRIGRTGRAGKKGLAVTLIIPAERHKLRFIEKIIRTELKKGKLASVEEVIAFQKEHIKQTVEGYRKSEKAKSFESIAQELLIRNTPVGALSSLLEYTFKSALNPGNYKKIEEVTFRSSTESRDRRRRPSRGYESSSVDSRGRAHSGPSDSGSGLNRGALESFGRGGSFSRSGPRSSRTRPKPSGFNKFRR
jgi:ATP-dependent RNA helicase DeaD